MIAGVVNSNLLMYDFIPAHIFVYIILYLLLFSILALRTDTLPNAKNFK